MWETTRAESEVRKTFFLALIDGHPSQRRWRVARALSLDALIVQASTMSRPILETLGFEATADLIAIIDTPAPDKRSTTSPTG